MNSDKKIVVVGAGISGLTAALHLAEKGFSIILVDRSDVSGGILPRLDIQFPNDHCGMCRILPMIDREGAQDFCLKRGVFHENIEFLPLTEVGGISGNPGNLEVELRPVNGEPIEEPRTLTRILAVILAGGGAVHDPSNDVLYNMAELPNVMTALDFEALVAGSPEGKDRVSRPSDGTPASRIAWIQCVGSRTLKDGSPFCASACCMFAVKEAVHVKKMTGGSVDAAIFYMDMRTFGRDYQKYRDRAESELGVRFVRCRVHSIEAAETPGDLEIFYVDPDGRRCSEIFSMAVLSTGKATSPEKEKDFRGLASVKGVHLLACATEFRDISDSVKSSQAVISEVETLLKDLGSETGAVSQGASAFSIDDPVFRARPNPQLLLIRSDAFCDADAWTRLADLAESETGLKAEVIEGLDSTAAESLRNRIVEKGINRVLIAAVRPSTTLPGKAVISRLLGLPSPFVGIADLTPYFAFTGSSEDGDSHAMAMIRSALRYLERARIYPEFARQTRKKVLVVGAGPAGLMAAKSIADAGYEAVIIEKEASVGGNSPYVTGSTVQEQLQALVRDVTADPSIEILTGYTLKENTGHAGDFRALAVSETDDPVIVEHGAVILATGGGLNKTTSYHYGEDDRIVTIAAFREKVDAADPALASMKTVAMILCADSREEPFNYCSRICCLKTLETAIALREQHPDTRVFVFYRDIMTYGHSEAIYTRAREAGVLFVQYRTDARPGVELEGKDIILKAHDPFSGFEMTLKPDMLCLAPGLIPGSGKRMASLFDIELTPEGFVREADYKWRPVDTGREGIFVAGLARAPGRIDEILDDGRAAASRATRLLSRDLLVPSGISARVRDTACSRCGICIGVCPYGARYKSLVDDRVLVDAAACQGCGSCAVACPNSATIMSGFEDTAIMEALETLF